MWTVTAAVARGPSADREETERDRGLVPDLVLATEDRGPGLAEGGTSSRLFPAPELGPSEQFLFGVGKGGPQSALHCFYVFQNGLH